MKQIMMLLAAMLFTCCSSDSEVKAEPAPVQNAAKTPAAGMKKPTAEEIRAYCKDKGYAIDAEHFINYYEANGWKVGRNAMKSWKAALANWAARDRGKGTMYSAASPDANTAAYNGIL